MDFIRGVFRLIFALLIVAVGVVLVIFDKTEIMIYADDYYEQLLLEIPEIPEVWHITYRQVLGGAITFVGVIWALLIVIPRGRTRSVTFEGTHGEVTVELEPVEATLERIALKLPEVKNISIQLKPLEGDGRIQVLAVAILAKSADDDARMVTARIHNFLQIHTRKITGLRDIEAKLRVKRFIMNMKSVKPEPLLLDAPDESAAKARKSTHKSASSTEAPAVQSTAVQAPTPTSTDAGSGEAGRLSKY